MLIDGKKISEEIMGRLKSQPTPKKFLAIVLVGSDPASVSFIKQKEKTAKALGVDFRLYTFPESIKNDELRDEVGKIAAHKTCGGVVIQLPLPEHVNRHYILNAVPREKDVDILGERALGAFYAGRNPVLPPAVGVVEEILKSANFDIKGKKAVVIGAGILVGKPIAHWLMSQTNVVSILRSGSDFGILKDADLIIAGTGKAGLLKSEMLKAGAGVIDFGYGVNEGGKVGGDLDALGDLSKLAFYTPTPGGTGPILVAKLFENFYILNKNA